MTILKTKGETYDAELKRKLQRKKDDRTNYVRCLGITDESLD